MDLATILGLVAAIAAITAPRYLGVGSDNVMFAQSTVYVAFGALGAALVGRRMQDLLHLPDVLRQVLWQIPEEKEAAREVMEMADVAQRAGLHALVQEAQYVQNALVRSGAEMIGAGASAGLIREILEKEAVGYLKQHGRAIKLLASAASSAPTVGIILSISSIASICGVTSDPGQMFNALGPALSCSVYGLILGNLVLGPLAEKMKNNIEMQAEGLERIIDTLVAIRQQENPRTIKACLGVGTSVPTNPDIADDKQIVSTGQTFRNPAAQHRMHLSSP